MKLLYCRSCHDVVRLIHTKWRMCECELSGGQYNNDLITATVGGNCRVFGIPNPWLEECETTFHIRDDARQWFRDTHGNYGNEDIWWGEKPGDFQVIRLIGEDEVVANGPRLKVSVKKLDATHTRTTILDKREYRVGDGTSPNFIDCENILKPSYKNPKSKKKSNGQKEEVGKSYRIFRNIGFRRKGRDLQ